MHRPLIRATLPRPEGQPPPTRPAPDFTIRQPGGRPEPLPSAAASAAASRFRATGPERQHGQAGSRGGMPRHGGGRPPARTVARRGRRRPAWPAVSGTASDSSRQCTCPTFPANTVSSSVSPTSGRSRGRSRRPPRPAGARLALTYPSERLEENVRELAATLENPLVLPCDVASDEQIAALAATLDREFGGLDFLVHGAAFAPRPELSNPFVQTSREGFRIALDISAYSLIALTRAVGAADGEARRRQHPHADLSRQRARVHRTTT